jgi:hypothetical protein
MKLSGFERSGKKSYPRFVLQVQDVSGDERFELTIAGPEPEFPPGRTHASTTEGSSDMTTQHSPRPAMSFWKLATSSSTTAA